MRGLTTFISAIRKCRSKEEESKRINKELANIRSKFGGRHLLNGYDKKKYLCKLIYIFFLGHKSELGHMEAINALAANAYSEKQIGYLFVSVLMDEGNKFAPLIINSLKNDLGSPNQSFQHLALQFISNNANQMISDMLTNQVFEILTSTCTLVSVKQTAALTFLRLLQLTPSLVSSSQFSSSIVHLLSHHDLGLVTASASLIEWMASQLPTQSYFVVKPAIVRLNRLVSRPPEDYHDYAYYEIAAPWLVVKLLRILQAFPAPSDMVLRFRFKESLELILNKALMKPRRRNFESLNARYAVIFEAIRTIVKTDIDQSLTKRSLEILGRTLQHTESNFRLITLDVITQLSHRQELKETIATYWESILEALRSERDISIRKRAIDLLHGVCDAGNVRDIAMELISFVKERNDAKEMAVSKLATLSQRFRHRPAWYVDITFELLLACGDPVDDSIWYSLVKVVSENPFVHAHAARTAFTYLHVNPCPDIVVKAAGYILGEFGHAAASDPDYNQADQLDMLQEVYQKCSSSTRALLLTTFMKFINVYPELKERIQSIFREKGNIRSEEVEIQQRAVEYLVLSEMPDKTAIVTTRNEMPQNQQKGGSFVFESERNPQENSVRNSSEMMAVSSVSLGSLSEINDCFLNPTKEALSHAPSNASKVPDYLLIDISDEASAPSTASPNAAVSADVSKPLQASPSPVPLNQKFIPNLMYQPSGILYENHILRILLRKEFEKHYATLYLMYTNKSERPLADFTVRGSFASLHNKCRVWFKPECIQVQPGSCIMQNVHVECLREFVAKPSLTLRFMHQGNTHEVKLSLPLTMYMFISPCGMSPWNFLTRWNSMESPELEVGRCFVAKFPMMYDIAKAKLRGFHLFVVENVFENVQNTVCSTGLFHSRSGKVGFLLVLECDLEEKKYTLTVRSKQRSLSTCVSNLLYDLL